MVQRQAPELLQAVPPEASASSAGQKCLATAVSCHWEEPQIAGRGKRKLSPAKGGGKDIGVTISWSELQSRSAGVLAGNASSLREKEDLR